MTYQKIDLYIKSKDDHYLILEILQRQYLFALFCLGIHLYAKNLY